ncbi:phosphoribosylglycinamide formyltransferase [Alphaproteobacteria bacterium]|nr:phosphoribosylglycinamide formyltransferase [Alphaproteobacteria bacterium]
MQDEKTVLILASGNGSNAQAIVEHSLSEKLPIRFLCGCNRPSSKAGIYGRMEAFGIKTEYLPSPGTDFAKLEQYLAEHRVDMIVLAGYMRILPRAITERYNILNIHPSLLPFKYKGSQDAYQDAIDNGDKITGCTVHRVTADVDGGQRLGQIAFEIPEVIVKNKDTESLKKLGLCFEHALYPCVVESGLFNVPLSLEAVDKLAGKIRKARGIGFDAPSILPHNHAAVFDRFPER